MKKFVLTLLVLLAGSSMTALAQDEIFDNPDNKVYFGARLGLDISCPGDVSEDNVSFDMFDSGAGFDLGGILNIPLWKNLYFEPGLSIYYNTMGSDIELADTELEGMTADLSVRRFGFRVPFQFGYRFDFQPVAISAFTGPVLNYGLVGKYHMTVKQGNLKGSESESCWDSINRASIGWKFGVGATYGSYVFQISGTVGMTDSMKKNLKYHDNNIAITIGYNFGF